jgi:hypothetical protein
MIHQFTLFPGITLRCVPDDRFKQACMTVQLVHPMSKEEAPLNALVPAVLLRGTESAPDIRSITQRLDDLYGASVGVCIRRVGDYQTTGFGCGFVEDRLALSGDRILEPMVQFLKELLLCPVLENGIFRQDYVETEKKNLTDYLQSQYNDKIRYANLQLLRYMCKADSYGVPRLGEAEDVQKVTAQALYDYYRRILKECPIEIFYVGSARPETVAALVKEVDERATIHDFRMVMGPTHTNLIFDTVVPFGGEKTNHQIEEEIKARVRQMEGVYFAVVRVENSYV